MTGNAGKPLVPFEEISRAVREARFPTDVSAVIAVLRGGRVPASLVAFQLSRPLHSMRIVFRDDANNPQTASPRLVGRPAVLSDAAGTVLLVDDVSVSGATFAEARRHLGPRRILTVALKGNADIVVMPDLPSGCVRWPWNEE